jgi:hypothetical protein
MNKATNIEIDNDLMDIETSVSYTNKPVKADDGYVRGALVGIVNAKIDDKKKKKSGTSTMGGSTGKIDIFKFVFQVEGVTAPITMKKSTGLNLRPEKAAKAKASNDNAGDSGSTYNVFTDLLLTLKVLTVEELESRSDIGLKKASRAIKNISKDNPIYIKTKLKDNTYEGDVFEIVDHKTIELIEKFDIELSYIPDQAA